MSGVEPIVPDPLWERPMPTIPDEEVYEDDDEDWEDS